MQAGNWDDQLQTEAEKLADAFERNADAGEINSSVDPMRSSIGQEYMIDNESFGFYYKLNGSWIRVALSRVPPASAELIHDLEESSD